MKAVTGLPKYLESVYAQYHRPKYLELDPLSIVREYQDPRDLEVAALIGALLAYGNVKQIRASVRNVFERMGSLARYVEKLEAQSSRADFNGFSHRFHVGDDIALLLKLLQRSWKLHGSLGAHFKKHLKPEDLDFTDALSALIADWKKWSEGEPQGKSFKHLLNAPSDGSCCKRWCMLLRWMGRKDDLDLGLWNPYGLRPDQLVMPLDTHTGRICKELGLTERKTLNWKAAQEITARFKEICPEDPVRYDFSLCRLGMVDGAPGTRGSQAIA